MCTGVLIREMLLLIAVLPLSSLSSPASFSPETRKKQHTILLTKQNIDEEVLIFKL